MPMLKIIFVNESDSVVLETAPFDEINMGMMKREAMSKIITGKIQAAGWKTYQMITDSWWLPYRPWESGHSYANDALKQHYYNDTETIASIIQKNKHHFH